jgi:hypothetical protein
LTAGSEATAAGFAGFSDALSVTISSELQPKEMNTEMPSTTASIFALRLGSINRDCMGTPFSKSVDAKSNLLGAIARMAFARLSAVDVQSHLPEFGCVRDEFSV